MFIHGGYWRSLEPSMFSQSAAGPNALGITVAVRTVDEAQYENRLRNWDFDIITFA